MTKRNEGFTLIELMVTILVASIVASAAAAVLLMGLRMHKASTETAAQQTTVRAVMSVMEELASEKEIEVISDSEGWTIYQEAGAGKSVLFSYKSGAIYTLGETVLLEGIDSSIAVLDGNLLEVTVTMEDGESYPMKAYCRLLDAVEATSPKETNPDSELAEKSGLAPDEASSISAFSIRSVPKDYLSTNWLAVSFAQQRQNFLDVLEGELGSTGVASTGEYFSEWYIGGYADNPGWDENTPWCACFVSWALEQCAGDLMEVPRFAHVDAFMADFSLGFWRTKDPSPGDVIFFDWTPDAVQAPEHVGVVTAVEGGMVHTIEGNAAGRVAKCSYEADDPCILGYGVLKWK